MPQKLLFDSGILIRFKPIFQKTETKEGQMTCLSSFNELNKRGTLRFFFFFFKFIDLSLRDEIICLAVPGLSCIMQNLWLQHVGSSCLTRDWIWAPCTGIRRCLNPCTEGGNRTGSILGHTVDFMPRYYMPSIYGNDIPTGKPGPRKEEPQGSPLPKRIP